MTKLIGSSGLEPDIKQGMGQPLSQTYFEPLLEPGLSDDQRQQDGDDDEKDDKLVEKRDRISLLDGIEEGAVPFVEPNLPEHIADQHHDNGQKQSDDRPTRSTAQEIAQETKKIADNTARARRLASLCTQNMLRCLLDSLRGLDGLTEVGFLLNSCRRGRQRAVAAGQAFGFMLLSWHGALLAPISEACLCRLDPMGAYERKGCQRPYKDPTLPPL